MSNAIHPQALGDLSLSTDSLGKSLCAAADLLSQASMCGTRTIHRGAIRIALELVRKVYADAPALIAELEGRL